MTLPISDTRARLASWLCLLAVGLSICGCSDNAGRNAIRGTVTVDGVALDDGYIVFRPVGNGQTAGSKVEGGKYFVPSDKGLEPGEYRVEVTAMRATGKSYIDDESGKTEQELEQYLPREYNQASKLSVQITSDSNNEFPFDLTTTP